MAIADDAHSFLRTLIQNELNILNNISYTLFIWGFGLFVYLQFTEAPYGRYTRTGFGFQVPGRLAWFVQELPSILVPVLFVIYSECPRLEQWKNKIALGLFLLHYFQRTFIFSLLIKGGKPTPFTPFAVAVFFCSLNGYLQGRHLQKYADLSTVSNLQFFAGVTVFLTGMTINIHSDHVLRNLRKDGEKGYKIPYGGLFQYVSGANFFGEVLEWWGFALVCGTLPTLAFAVFTACNIGPRAVHHHRWYLEKFEDYPKDRKAFLPGIL